MSITLVADGSACRLTFEGSITFEFWRELEDRIIDALRRYTHFEVDLSGIREVDLCGIHLIEMLRSVGGTQVKIVATSPLVDQTSRRLLAPQRLASLACHVRRNQIIEDHRSGALQARATTAGSADLSTVA